MTPQFGFFFIIKTKQCCFKTKRFSCGWGVAVPRCHVCGTAGVDCSSTWSSAGSSKGFFYFLFFHAVLESDSSKAIGVLNRTYSDSSAVGMIADDVLQFASSFSNLNFVFLVYAIGFHRLTKFSLSISVY